MEKYPDSPVGFLAYLAIGIARVSASLSSYPGESPSMTATSPAVPVFLRLGAGEVRLQQFCPPPCGEWLLLGWSLSCWTQNGVSLAAEKLVMWGNSSSVDV